jgi:hypothetical protein
MKPARRHVRIGVTKLRRIIGLFSTPFLRRHVVSLYIEVNGRNPLQQIDGGREIFEMRENPDHYETRERVDTLLLNQIAVLLPQLETLITSVDIPFSERNIQPQFPSQLKKLVLSHFIWPPRGDNYKFDAQTWDSTNLVWDINAMYAISKLPHIESLNVSFPYTENDGICSSSFSYAVLEHTNSLRHLMVVPCQSDGTLTGVAALKQLTSLEIKDEMDLDIILKTYPLPLTHVRINRVDEHNRAALLSLSPTLTSLCIELSHVDVACQLEQLRILEVVYSKPRPSNASFAFMSIGQCLLLEELRLSTVRVVSHEMRNTLQHLKCLKKLSLKHVTLDTHGLSFLDEVNQTLTHLSMVSVRPRMYMLELQRVTRMGALIDLHLEDVFLSAVAAYTAFEKNTHFHAFRKRASRVYIA